MEKFLARQPIFNSKQLVYGYELLFRSGPENYFPSQHPDSPCASTVDRLFLIGLEKLTRGRRAFINCDGDFLLRGYPALLPKDSVVLELLEDMPVNDAIVEICRDLKASGYLLALDDFVETPPWQPLIALADFIKMDVLAASEVELQRIARQFAKTPVKLVAEKVETYEMFRKAQDLGYGYFQGNFFCRPEILGHHDVPVQKLTCLRILRATSRAELDLDEIAQGIKSEPSLAYRLLRYLNSSAFFLSTAVRSIPQSLVMLGERGVRRWVSLIAIALMAEGKSEELVLLPMIRARFCELLAAQADMARFADDLFLLGLLSVLDAILDMPMSEVLRELPVPPEIRDALLGKPNRFRDILDLAIFYEGGCWENLEATACRIGIDPDALPDTFMQALDWGRTLNADEPATQFLGSR